MLPRFSTPDETDEGEVHAKLRGHLVQGCNSDGGPNLPNRIISQLGQLVGYPSMHFLWVCSGPVSIPSRMISSALRNHVSRVFRVSPKPEMRGVTTGRVVARVENIQNPRINAEGKPPHDASGNEDASCVIKRAVAADISVSTPRPALIWCPLGYSREKPLLVRFRQFWYSLLSRHMKFLSCGG